MKADSLHKDIAAYKIQQAEKWNHHPLKTAGRLASTFEVRPLLISLAIEIGSEKLASIAARVAEIEDQREAQGSRCRRQVSDKQRHALAAALLEKYGSPRNIVKAAWHMTDQEIDDAEA